MDQPATIRKAGVEVSARRSDYWYATLNHARVLELLPLVSPNAAGVYLWFWCFAGKRHDLGAMRIGNLDPAVYRDLVNWVARYIWGAAAGEHLKEARAILLELKTAGLITWGTKDHIVYVVNFEHDQTSGRKAREAADKRESRGGRQAAPTPIVEEPSAAPPGVASQADDRGASARSPAAPGALPEEAEAQPSAALLGPPRAPASPLPPSPASTQTPTRRTAFGFDQEDPDTRPTFDRKGNESRKSERDIRPFDSTQRHGGPCPTAGDGGRGDAEDGPVDESDVYALTPVQMVDLACRATGEHSFTQRQSFESTMRSFGPQTFAAGLVQYRQAVRDGIKPKNAKKSYGMMLNGYVKRNGERGP